jgi:SOS-response transcriptional repressor LexA
MVYFLTIKKLRDIETFFLMPLNPSMVKISIHTSAQNRVFFGDFDLWWWIVG